MEEAGSGIVMVGEAAASRDEPDASPPWLTGVIGELWRTCEPLLQGPFVPLSGGRLVGLLAAGVDPLAAYMRATLQASPGGVRLLRWAIVAGPIEPHMADRTTAQAGLGASAVAEGLRCLAATRRDRTALVLRTGHAGADRLLDDLGPVLAEAVAGLTLRQRDVARLVLDEGLRQADAAERLGIARSTVSVIVARARIRSLERLLDATRIVFAAGLADLAASHAGGRRGPGGDATGDRPTGDRTDKDGTDKDGADKRRPGRRGARRASVSGS